MCAIDGETQGTSTSTIDILTYKLCRTSYNDASVIPTRNARECCVIETTVGVEDIAWIDARRLDLDEDSFWGKNWLG